MIKFFDLKAYNAQFKNEFAAAYQNVIASGRYILGDAVKTFETDFASYCGTQYCIGTGNGLDALTIIFKGYINLGLLKEGDHVIVPANTYIASILAIIQAGLQPILVEPDIATYNISAKSIESAITWKTRAILVVHLYGQLADMKAINAIAKEQELLIIEDAAQAHGAVNDEGLKAGNLGNASGFSFYPSKNLGSLGDAGGITTSNKDLADLVRKIANYGTSSKYVNDVIGGNSRLDEIQAAILNVKLEKLDKDNAVRRTIAQRYLSEIANDKVVLPTYGNGLDHVFHQFVVRVNDRNDFINYLHTNGVETLIHYPIAPHKQKALKDYNHLNLPVTEKIHDTVVSIPLNPILTETEINTIVELINAY